jgi:hypothetical protein
VEPVALEDSLVTVPLHVRVTAQGSLGSPESEIFSYGFALRSVQANSTLFQRWSTEADEDWHRISQLVREYHGRATTWIDSRCIIRRVKLALIGPDPANSNRPIYLAPPKISTASPTAGGGAFSWPNRIRAAAYFLWITTGLITAVAAAFQ